jgi:Spy/CpxP family protein refolding chaperone
MTSHDIDSSKKCPSKPRRARRWGRRVLLALGLTLGVGGVAYAAGPTGFHGHPRTPEEMRAHTDQMVDHLMTKVDGSEQQRTAIKAIAARTAPQMEKLHAEGQDLKTEFHELLSAEKIDRVALEAARKDAMELADRGSKIVLNSVVEAAEALTPAQRKTIAATMAHFQR